MVVYIFIILLFVITAACSVDRHINKGHFFYFTLIMIPILSVFSGTRLVGLDYEAYVDHFNAVPSILNYQRTDDAMEIGYEFFLSICKTIFGSFHAFLLIFSTLSVFLAIWLCYRYSPYPWLSFYMFFAFSFFPQVMGQMRQPIAIVITFLGLVPLLLRQRIWVAVLWVIIVSVCFHKSLFFLLPFLLIGTRLLSRKQIFCFLGGAFLCYLILPFFITSILRSVPENFYLYAAIDAYLGYQSVAITFTLGMVERLIMITILFYYGCKYCVYQENLLFRLFANMYFIGVCIYFIFISVSAEFASRGTQGLNYALFFALPILLKSVRLREKYILLGIILLWGVYLSFSFVRGGIFFYVPYKSILL